MKRTPPPPQTPNSRLISLMDEMDRSIIEVRSVIQRLAKKMDQDNGPR